MHTVKHILIQMCIYSKEKKCDSKYKIKFLENILTFLHFLFNDSKSFFQCLKSFFQCLKCRFLQTMLNKVFSQLKSTTMASVRPKLVTRAVHVFIPICNKGSTFFLSQFHYIKSQTSSNTNQLEVELHVEICFRLHFESQTTGGHRYCPESF